MLKRFVAAVGAGNTGALESLFANDVVAYSVGGGIKAAALVPVCGAEKVARCFTGLVCKSERANRAFRVEFASINGAAGL